MTTRVGVIGTGYWGESWVPVILKNPDTRFSGIYGRSSQSVRDVATAYELSNDVVFNDLDAFLRAGHDLVIVAVHHRDGLHRSMGERALNAGADLMVEKPFAENIADAGALVELAEANKRRLIVGQNFRYHSNVLAVKSWLDEGLIGKLLGADIQMRGWFSPDAPAWRLEQPYPHIMELGVHSLDMIRFLFGKNASRVTATSTRLEGSHFASASMSNATIELDGGLHVHWSANTETRVRSTNVIGEWHIYGTDGVIEIMNENAWCYVAGHEVTNCLAGILGESTLTSGRDRMLASYVHSLTTGKPMSHTGQDNLDTLRLLLAIIGSSEAGQPQAVA